MLLYVAVSDADKADFQQFETAGSDLPAMTSPTSIPETLGYRIKNESPRQAPWSPSSSPSERLRRAIALGVLAPDCISSSAYGTEEMLTQMTPLIGLAAFALVVPIMFVILGVLFFVTTSYMDVIKYYTTAGGSYVVARDSFGPKIAQIAAVALFIDYTVTVAVQLGRHRGAHECRADLEQGAVD